MVPHVDTDTLLFELDQRRKQAAMHRLAAACKLGQESHTGRLGPLLGSVLIWAGALVLGDDRLLHSWSQGQRLWRGKQEP